MKIKKNYNGQWFFGVIVLLVTFTGVGYAENYRQVFPVNSPVYKYMDAIYMEAGLVHPNKARPWSAKETLFILDRIDRSSLSLSGKNAYDYIYRKTRGEDEIKKLELGDTFKGRIGVQTTAEVFSRYTLAKDEETDTYDYLWHHGYEDRKPLLEIPIEFLLNDSIYMLSELFIKEEHGTVHIREDDEGQYPDGVIDNYTNLVFDDPNARIDLYFPFRSFLSIGGEHWGFRFGRDSLSWGNGRTGNMMLSDYSDYYDFLSLSFYGKRIKLTNVYTMLDPYSPSDGEGGEAAQFDSFAFLGRRLDIRITDRVLLSLSESLVLKNRSDYLLTDLNYLMIFHNRLLTGTNSLMAAELSVNPWKNMNFYGQFVMDEFRTSYEGSLDGGGGPLIIGYLLGGSGVYPFKEGYLSLCVEGAYTDPLLYHRDSSPYYYNVRKYYSLTTDSSEYVVKPLGYRYGPDSVVGYFETEYSVPGGISALFSLSYILQGENRFLFDVDPEFESKWEDKSNLTSPTGIVEKQVVLHLSGEYPFLPWLKAGAGFYYSYIDNLGNNKGRYRHSLELTSFVTITPR